MDRFGLIGFPLGHSKSPASFAAAYGGRYPYDLLEGEDFDVLWQRFLKAYKAVNVTAPFKEAAFRKADIRSPEVQQLRASNLVVKTAEGTVAYNSDYRGLVSCLKRAGLKAGDSALVVGCGGAGKAAAGAARDCGLRTRITNRTMSKAEAVADYLGVDVCDFEQPQDADLLLYTIPGRIDRIERFSARVYLEASYAHPAFDAETLARRGNLYISGWHWLFEQAVAGYGLMTGEEPDIEAMRKEYNF